MDLRTFLTTFSQSLEQHRVIAFIQSGQVSASFDAEYPLLFFSMIHTKIKELGKQVIAIDVLEQEPELVSSQLSMSFLGDTAIYWLRSFHELDGKKKQHWLAFARAYEGPHQLMFFADGIDNSFASSTHAVVEVPPLADAQLFGELMKFFKPEAKISNFVQALFMQRKVMSLDTACIILSYATVVGAGYAQFMQSNLNKIVVSDKSLFTLSQHFFAKSPTSFFSLWLEVASDYPEPFWISFWSEQLWRAYYFVKYTKEKDLVKAKKASFRLPFSFIQRDWRKVGLEELKHAHQALYDFDFNFKNGASMYSLEAIYHTFLSDGYKK